MLTLQGILSWNKVYGKHQEFINDGVDKIYMYIRGHPFLKNLKIKEPLQLLKPDYKMNK